MIVNRPPQARAKSGYLIGFRQKVVSSSTRLNGWRFLVSTGSGIISA